MTTFQRRKLWSYTNLHSGMADVCFPKTEHELAKVFADARAQKRNVTLRAGGHSFDRQSLGNDIVVSMEHFKGIGDVVDGCVTVRSGDTWGDILRALQRQGFAPYVTVTTEHATAGGTLSGDCLSRFSTAWGKEGERIRSFRIVTPIGALDCTPPDPDAHPSDWTRPERVFVAAIGGLGYLGAVTDITYEVLRVQPVKDRIRVHTTARKCTCQELAQELIRAARNARPPAVDDPDKDDAVYAALTPEACGTREGLLLTSRFHDSDDGRPMLLFRPRFLLRIPLEWLLRWVWFNRLFWRGVIRWGFRRRQRYVDDLDGYTFFMDGNVRAKKAAKRFGSRLKVIQQTFIVPLDTTSDDGWAKGEADLVRWLGYARDVMQAKDLTPTLHDVLFLPKDMPFPLSATADTAGFAVSYAFETNRRRVLDTAAEVFEELSDGLWTDFGGRVYLVKNVNASPQTLSEMYGTRAEEFFAVKAEVDPDGILCNEFLETTFPEHLAGPVLTPTP
jgi:decaprenylphospho-beta-D-ribofuranose 2-oxidase